MTRLFPILALALFASSASAEVLNPRQEVTIAGTANPACVIKGPALASGNNISFAPSGSNAGEIRFTQLVNASTAEVREAQVDLVLPIICNSAHRFVLKSANRGLSRIGDAPANGAFRTSVPYSVKASWQGRQLDQSSEAGDFVIDIPGSGAGDLSLSIAVPPGGQPLVAGSYSDTITVQLEVAS
jgi:hypothetical protein